MVRADADVSGACVEHIGIARRRGYVLLRSFGVFLLCVGASGADGAVQIEARKEARRANGAWF